MWSKKAAGEDANGNRTYTEGYHIVDAATRAEAITAPGLPARNATLADDPRYKRGPITFSNYNGPTQWLAILTYAIPPNGSWNGGGEDEDPLLKPWVWTVQASWAERASDVDVRRRPKKNSAGDYFPPTPKRFRRRILIGRRYERFWDLAKCQKFENTCNANMIDLGPIVIQPGEALCHSIEPSGDFEGDADYLLMEYQIEVGTDERARDPAHPNDPPTTSGFPFDTHQLDIGNCGWYTGSDSKPKRGRFCYATGTTAANVGNVVTGDAEDVQLNGAGRPYPRPSTEAKIYVRDWEGKHIYDPIENPNQAERLVDGIWPTGQQPTESPYSTDANRMWLFRDYDRVDWTDLFRLSSPPTPL
jgi:hypothetical protein